MEPILKVYTAEHMQSMAERRTFNESTRIGLDMARQGASPLSMVAPSPVASSALGESSYSRLVSTGGCSSSLLFDRYLVDVRFECPCYHVLTKGCESSTGCSRGGGLARQATEDTPAFVQRSWPPGRSEGTR